MPDEPESAWPGMSAGGISEYELDRPQDLYVTGPGVTAASVETGVSRTDVDTIVSAAVSMTELESLVSGATMLHLSSPALQDEDRGESSWSA